MRVGVTGSAGLVGGTLVPLWRRAGLEVVAWTRAELDLLQPEQVGQVIGDARVDAVVHLAAYTDVDRAESEPESAMLVNGLGTGLVAAACREAGARCVYVSSDYVLQGDGRAPLPPDAPLAPAGAYARSKAAGEQAVAGAGGDWMIARTGWVFGPGGKNFVDTMRAKAAAGAAVKVVDDQVGAPTSTRLIASVLLALLEQGGRGTWHIAPAGRTSWHGVARAVYAAAGADPALVTPCATADFPRPAPRPRFSVLDVRATESALGAPLPPWERDVDAYTRTGALPASAWEHLNA